MLLCSLLLLLQFFTSFVGLENVYNDVGIDEKVEVQNINELTKKFQLNFKHLKRKFKSLREVVVQKRQAERERENGIRASILTAIV